LKGAKSGGRQKKKTGKKSGDEKSQWREKPTEQGGKKKGRSPSGKKCYIGNPYGNGVRDYRHN